MTALSFAPPTSPKAAKTWPLWLGILLALSVLGALPATRQWFLAWDTRIAYWMNGLLGHSKGFDLFVAWLNGNKGDAAVIVVLFLFFAAHCCIPWDRRKVCEKAAYWVWVGATLMLLVVVVRVAERVFDRDSPARVLEGWFDLKKVYRVHTRVGSGRCFPSGHAVAFFYFAILATRRFPWLGLPLLAASLALPLSRLMSGAHWASDVYLVSLALAGLYAAVCYETSIVKMSRWGEVLLGGLWHAAEHRRQRRFPDRVGAAWAEFLSDTPAPQSVNVKDRE